MTTNAIDKAKGLVASDSRWSFQLPGSSFLGFVDDTGFDKIADRPHFACIICAGDGTLIDEWRDWFTAPVLNTAALPRTERDTGSGLQGITVSLLLKPDGRVLFSSGWYLDHEGAAAFSGSGAHFARDCYSRNRCGKQAVRTAGTKDPATGGETKFLDLATGDNNLSRGRVTLSDAHKQLMERGMIMDTNTGKVVGQVRDLLTAMSLTGGEVNLSAPTGLPSRPWTEAEREDALRAMRVVADLEAAAKAQK